MADISREEVRLELAALRSELGQKLASPIADTEWSAHANWKSSSRVFDDYDFSSRLRLPEKVDVHPLLERVINDSSSDRFLEVANSLKTMMGK